jgi:hypothetical protein
LEDIFSFVRPPKPAALSMDLIKAQNRIVSESCGGDLNTFTLGYGSKLGHSFNYLPFGIINKNETGIGATTLELSTPRNSIIVEPLKIIASSKVYAHTQHVNSQNLKGYASPGAIYVGSRTSTYRKPVSRRDIKQYHLKSGYKKIVVVADSLGKVISAIGNDVYSQYFLMVDEADAFQIDSVYRSAMSLVVDHFKKFDADKRALVTATPLRFSDPELNSLPQTMFQYDNPTKRTIQTVYTETIGETLVIALEKLITAYPSDKILIAYNSPVKCVEIADHLVKEGTITADQVAILCSVNSRTNAGKYYMELDTDKLPCTLNFISAAYFSGFDLHENYRLVSVSNAESPVYMLSDHKLKQIAGRCRLQLLSETLIYSIRPTRVRDINEQDLLTAAETELRALDCMENQFKSHSYLKENLEPLRKLLIDNPKVKGLEFVRTTIDGNNAISYLNIDAELEKYRIAKQLYARKKSLPEKLKKDGHIVTHQQHTGGNLVVNTSPARNKQQETDEVITLLQNKDPNDTIEDVKQSRGSWTKRQSLILDIVQENYGLVDLPQLLGFLKQAGGKRDDRPLKNIKFRYAIFTQSPESAFSVRLQHLIKAGDEYSPEELLERWSKQLAETGIQHLAHSSKIAAEYTKSVFQVNRKRTSGKYLIGGLNPGNVTVLHHRKDGRMSISDLLRRM